MLRVKGKQAELKGSTQEIINEMIVLMVAFCETYQYDPSELAEELENEVYKQLEEEGYAL